MNAPSTHGFVLPIVLCAMLAAGILVGGALNLTLNATRTAGVHTTATRCRLSAQTALDREKLETQTAFVNYFPPASGQRNAGRWLAGARFLQVLNWVQFGIREGFWQG